MLRRLTLPSLRALALAIAATVMLIISLQVWGPDAEAGPSRQASQTRTVDWYYWLDTGYPQIQRARLDGSGVAETVVSNTELSTTNDFALDPGGDYVYWADDGHNQIRRKSADGTGSVETLVSAGISSPYRIAVDYSYVYWADTGNDTIKRAQTFGAHTVATIADSSDGVSNVAAIALDGSYLYWADNGNDSVREVATFSPYTVTTLVSTGLSNPEDLAVGRNGSYVYVLDRNNTASTVKRVQTFGSHTVTTLASNTGDTPMDDPVALTLDPDHDFVYWLDEDDRAVRRVAADGATGTFETLTTSAGGDVTDLVVSPDGGAVYWLDNSSNTAKRIAADGSGSVTDVITSGLSSPLRIRVAQDTETVAGSCITDAGALDADYSTHDWEADIDATCPAAFYTFRLADAADLRIAATSSSINPLPILRKGGIGGEIVALTDAANGSSTPYVYQAEAGQHTIELVREFNSANPAGGFSAELQTQPMLSGCDVNLGTLSSEQLQVFGAHDPDCGDTRKYFFYLEFQASVSASASGVGFTPNIELRPGSASDSSTPTAQNSGNPADFYQSATSGSYRINVENITAGDTYNLSLQAFGLPPPTRTPIPTPTPRFQPNVDVRLDPDPRGVAYEDNEVYRFRVEGGAGSFPALIRSSNATAVRVTGSSGSTLDCTAGAQVDDLDQLDAIYVHVCDGGVSSTLEIIKEADYSLLAQYPIFVAGGPAPAPGAVDGPTDYGVQGEDPIGVGILVGAICDGANVDCNMELATNGLALALALFLGITPTLVARGRPSGFSLGIGIALGLATLLLATMWVGLPLWMVGAALLAVLGLALIGAFIKLRKLRA